MNMTKGRSREGAWIERSTRPYGHKYNKVAPVRERGLKVILLKCSCNVRLPVAPVRERGLKAIC